MKKYFKFILILLLIVMFFTEIIAEEISTDKISLPKIPIYIEGLSTSFSHSHLIRTRNLGDAFYSIQIKKTKTIYQNYNSELGMKGALIYGGIGALLGLCVDVPLWLISEKEVGGGETELDPFNPTFTVLSTLIASALGYNYDGKLHEPKPIKKEFQLLLFSKENVQINELRLIINQNETVLSSHIVLLLNSEKDTFISKYLTIVKSEKIYSNEYDFSPIRNKYSLDFSKLYKTRGEFETTSQYNERVRREQIRKNELQAEMEQEISIVKEKREIEKFALLQKIKKDMSYIEFTQFYDFELLNYNADKQYYTFNISGIEKKVIVPLMKAPKFKENISDYGVQKTFKPTLNGVWETISDDYVLINTITNEIIPWEGSIPTYVETSVENPPILSASVKLIEPSGEGYLDAEETSTIQVTLTNSGKGSAKMTRISLFQEDGHTLYYDVSNTIDEILPNKSVTAEFKISVPGNIESGNVEFKISFLEEQGFEPVPLTFTAQTREMPKPELIFVDFGVNDANGDGKISKGETADITLRLQNIGQGKAKNVSLDVVEDRLANLFIISEKHFELGNLESGESKDVTFTISTNNRVSDVVNINFNIQEKRHQFSIEDEITLELEKTQKQLNPIVFVGSDIKTEIIDAAGISIDIEENIPSGSKKNDNILAVVFGIEDYKNISDVSFAHRDARFIKEYFGKTLGVKENNIYYKANEDVSKAEFDKVFSKNGWLDKRVKSGKTEIYFYYAGHGAPDIKENKAYLIPYDGDPNYASQTGYEMEEIYDNLSDLKAKSVTVFLDACFTGANRESEMLLADARPLMIEVKSPIAKGITVFSATGQKEISSAWREKKHGLFSYFLMKGMQGEADANNDNKLTIKELGDYINEKVSEQAGYLDREQTPQMISNDEKRILINY